MYASILKAVVIELIKIKEKMDLPDDHKIVTVVAHLVAAIEILEKTETEEDGK